MHTSPRYYHFAAFIQVGKEKKENLPRPIVFNQNAWLGQQNSGGKGFSRAKSCSKLRELGNFLEIERLIISVSRDRPFLIFVNRAVTPLPPTIPDRRRFSFSGGINWNIGGGKGSERRRRREIEKVRENISKKKRRKKDTEHQIQWRRESDDQFQSFCTKLYKAPTASPYRWLSRITHSSILVRFTGKKN